MTQTLLSLSCNLYFEVYYTAIVTVRVPDELKAKMKGLNINWSEEIREFICRRIDEEERRRRI